MAGQTAVYGLSSIVARMLNYLMVPYLSRIMTEAQYGVIGDIYSWIPFLLVLLTMGLETGYFRFAGKAENEAAKREVFATTWGAVSGGAVIFMAVVLIFTPEIASALGYSDFPSYIRVAGAIVMFDVITAIPFARLRQEGKAGKFVMVRVASVAINIALTVFFYSALPALAEGGGMWSAVYDPAYGPGYMFVANLIASVAVLLMLWPAYRDTAPKINRKLLRTILIYSLPLLLSGIIGTANQFADRQLLKFLSPEAEAMANLGVYTVVMKLGTILLLFIQMYRYAAEPYFLTDIKHEDFVRANADALKYFIIFSLLIFLGLTLYGDLLALMMGRDFRGGMVILPVILLAYTLSGITFNLNFWYKKAEKTSYALWITGTGLVFTIALNVAFIPLYGYVGSAWARLGCEMAMLLLSYYLNQKHCRTPYDLRRIGEYFLLAAAIYATAFFTGDLPSPVRHALNMLLIAGFLFFAVKKEKIDPKAIIHSIFNR